MIDCSFVRLFIAKCGKDSSQDIYVDKCPEVQHQLDGIRFLYKSWKKKKCGVIMNDPPNYGKRVQTALFLSAIRPTLDDPVLILCQNEKKLRWLKIFREWTNLSDDIVNEGRNPFVPKHIVFSPTNEAEFFSCREWSILVLDDDFVPKNVLKTPLRANLRICITSDSVKHYLDRFTTFYSWIHPKKKLDIEKYKADESDPMDVYTKSVMLDALMEDYVLRREFAKPPIATIQVSNNIKSMTELTNKNKDDTSTNSKGLKRKSQDIDHTDASNSIKIPKIGDQNANLVSTHLTRSLNDVNMNEDAEDSIANDNIGDKGRRDEDSDIFSMFDSKATELVVLEKLNESCKDEKSPKILPRIPNIMKRKDLECDIKSTIYNEDQGIRVDDDTLFSNFELNMKHVKGDVLEKLKKTCKDKKSSKVLSKNPNIIQRNDVECDIKSTIYENQEIRVDDDALFSNFELKMKHVEGDVFEKLNISEKSPKILSKNPNIIKRNDLECEIKSKIYNEDQEILVDDDALFSKFELKMKHVEGVVFEKLNISEKSPKILSKNPNIIKRNDLECDIKSKIYNEDQEIRVDDDAIFSNFELKLKHIAVVVSKKTVNILKNIRSKTEATNESKDDTDHKVGVSKRKSVDESNPDGSCEDKHSVTITASPTDLNMKSLEYDTKSNIHTETYNQLIEENAMTSYESIIMKYIERELKKLNDFKKNKNSSSIGVTTPNDVKMNEMSIGATTPNDVKMNEMSIGATTPNDVKIEMSIGDTTPNDVKMKEMSIGATTPNYVKINEMSIGATTPNDVKIEMSIGVTTPNDVKMKEMSIGATTPNYVKMNEMSIGATTPNDVQIKEMSVGVTTPNDVKINEMSIGATTPIDVKIKEMSIGATTPNDVKIKEMSVGVTTPNDVKMNEISISATTTNDVKMNEMIIGATTPNDVQIKEMSVGVTTPNDVKKEMIIGDTTPNDVQIKEMSVGVTTPNDVKKEMIIGDTTPNDVKKEMIIGDTTPNDVKIKEASAMESDDEVICLSDEELTSISLISSPSGEDSDDNIDFALKMKEIEETHKNNLQNIFCRLNNQNKNT